MTGRAIPSWLRRWWPVLLLVALLGGYWLLPISGQVAILPGDEARVGIWPQVRLDPPLLQPGQEMALRVTDTVAWPYVLLTMAGRALPPDGWWENPGESWTWYWTLIAPEAGTELIFYHDCHIGCIERGRVILGQGEAASNPPGIPTKLGVVFANPTRDWHGRSGWDVELTYANLGDAEYWGIDDLAQRVLQSRTNGLRVLVRVDYAQGQSLPPAGDELALSEYLAYVRRLARDDRLKGVYGYFIGSGYNSAEANSQAPDRPVTPEWYARVFNGYGKPVDHRDNAVQTIRQENPTVRVLVGPMQPWNRDQDGEQRFEIAAPWLNYMNTLVAALDEAARAKAAAGIPLAAPDGFAVQAPGRPDAPELTGQSSAEEPRLDILRAAWSGAQAGFRIYRDWLAVVNAYSTTRGLPIYITSTNTFAPDQGIPPALNYPRGWLTAALEEVNAEPQVQALCWFLDEDRSGDARWDFFSLTRRPGRLLDTAEEFDALLQTRQAPALRAIR